MAEDCSNIRTVGPRKTVGPRREGRGVLPGLQDNPRIRSDTPRAYPDAGGWREDFSSSRTGRTKGPSNPQQIIYRIIDGGGPAVPTRSFVFFLSFFLPFILFLVYFLSFFYWLFLACFRLYLACFRLFSSRFGFPSALLPFVRSSGSFRSFAILGRDSS